MVQSHTRLQRFFGKKLARSVRNASQTARTFPRALPARPPSHVRRFVETVSATIQRSPGQSFDASSASLAIPSRRNRSQSQVDDIFGTIRDATMPSTPDATRAHLLRWPHHNQGRSEPHLLCPLHPGLVFHLLRSRFVLVEFCAIAAARFRRACSEAQGFFRRASTPRSIQSRAKPYANISGRIAGALRQPQKPKAMRDVREISIEPRLAPGTVLATSGTMSAPCRAPRDLA